MLKQDCVVGDLLIRLSGSLGMWRMENNADTENGVAPWGSQQLDR